MSAGGWKQRDVSPCTCTHLGHRPHVLLQECLIQALVPLGPSRQHSVKEMNGLESLGTLSEPHAPQSSQHGQLVRVVVPHHVECTVALDGNSMWSWKKMP